MTRWILTLLSDHATVAALLLSGFALLSSRQDATRHREFGAIFWQGFALFALIVNLLAAVVYKWWPSVPVVAVALGAEIWLARYWWSNDSERKKSERSNSLAD